MPSLYPAGRPGRGSSSSIHAQPIGTCPSACASAGPRCSGCPSRPLRRSAPDPPLRGELCRRPGACSGSSPGFGPPRWPWRSCCRSRSDSSCAAYSESEPSRWAEHRRDDWCFSRLVALLRDGVGTDRRIHARCCCCRCSGRRCAAAGWSWLCALAGAPVMLFVPLIVIGGAHYPPVGMAHRGAMARGRGRTGILGADAGRSAALKQSAPPAAGRQLVRSRRAVHRSTE